MELVHDEPQAFGNVSHAHVDMDDEETQDEGKRPCAIPHMKEYL